MTGKTKTVPITGFIPARANSKGLPGKNTAPLGGIPLYQHSVNVARAAGLDGAILSTDIATLLDATHDPFITLHPRPAALAGDEIEMIEVLLDFLDGWPGSGLMVLLQPTSPLRQAAQVKEAIALYQTGRFDMVMSANVADRAILKSGLLDGDRYRPVNDPAFVFANRQALPQVVRHNGAIYVFDTDWLRRNQSFASDRIGVTLMPPDTAVDVDGPEDLARCEAILAARGES